jgi:hypothetical protein
LSELLHNKLMQQTSDSVHMNWMKQRDISVEKQIKELIRSKKEMASVIKQLKTFSEKQDADLNQLLLTWMQPSVQDVNKEEEKEKEDKWEDVFLTNWNNRTDTFVKVSALHKSFVKKNPSYADKVKLADLKKYIKTNPSLFAVENPDTSNFTVIRIKESV